MDFPSWVIPVAIIAVVVIIVFVAISKWIVTAGASQSIIVSGATKDGSPKIVPPGGRTIVIPILQSSTTIDMTQNKLDIVLEGVDSNRIGVNVGANAVIKVDSSHEGIRAAAERFIADDGDQSAMTTNVKEILTGSLRSIVATMTVDDLISKREEVEKNSKVQASGSLQPMGISLESFTLTSITDKEGYINALGKPEAARVSRDARIASAESERVAKEAEISASILVSTKERDRAIREAELKSDVDKARAESQAAGPLAEAERERQLAVAKQQAAEEQAKLTERELDISERKPADAQAYVREREASAKKQADILNAEADARKRELSANIEAQAKVTMAEADAKSRELNAQAEAKARIAEAEANAKATEANGLAEANAVKAKGLAEAETIKAKGLAEAESIEKKALAMANYEEAGRLGMVLEKLPEIAHELSAPMSEIDNMTVISTEGASALPKSVMNNFTQLDGLLSNVTGNSLTGLLDKLTGEKASESLNPKVTGIDD